VATVTRAHADKGGSMTNAQYIRDGISRLFNEFAAQLPPDEDVNPIELFSAEMALQRAWAEYVNRNTYEPPRLTMYGESMTGAKG